MFKVQSAEPSRPDSVRTICCDGDLPDAGHRVLHVDDEGFLDVEQDVQAVFLPELDAVWVNYLDQGVDAADRDGEFPEKTVDRELVDRAFVWVAFAVDGEEVDLVGLDGDADEVEHLARTSEIERRG